MSLFQRIGSAFMLLIPLTGWAAEALSVRLIGGDAGFSAQVQTRIEALIRQTEPDINFVESFPANARRLLIAIGAKGWRGAEGVGADLPVLAVLPPRLPYDLVATTSNRPMSAVYGDMPPGRFFNFVQLLAPKKGSTVALIAGPSLLPRVSRFESLAAERNMHLHVEKIERESDVGPAVERGVQHASLMLALPDPVAHTAATVPPLLLITYRAGVPVVAYSEAYLRAGAVAALYATPEQIAQQVLEIVSAYKQGKPLPPAQTLKYFTVGLNTSVARSLGLTLPPAEELETRLRQMKE